MKGVGLKKGSTMWVQPIIESSSVSLNSKPSPVHTPMITKDADEKELGTSGLLARRKQSGRIKLKFQRSQKQFRTLEYDKNQKERGDKSPVKRGMTKKSTQRIEVESLNDI